MKYAVLYFVDLHKKILKNKCLNDHDGVNDANAAGDSYEQGICSISSDELICSKPEKRD